MRRSSSPRLLRKSLISLTPVLALGLLVVFVVALNMRHSSILCDSPNGQEGALNRAAMERRIRTLEDEILQNSLLMDKVLRGLDTAFGASAVLSVKELRRLAQTEASEIGERRSRQPPPPMSEFAKSRVSKAVDGGRLQDLVEAAVGSETGFLSEEEITMDGLPLGVLSRQGNGGNQGWDWGSRSSIMDDFLGGNEVDIIEPVKLDVTEEVRGNSCKKWFKEHGVTPGVDWGTLPAPQQQLWSWYRCDDVDLEEPLVAGAGEQGEAVPAPLPKPGDVGDVAGGGEPGKGGGRTR
ncbi:expressed unknown protein [Ectocarpus siliculosus]|uniref:Uncharacterized protein n=1 Tax=Ectocarpus siliculosus TaxID=2880 RepID=D7FIY0_ECTSI|nr:expressed unknown protein [Ectocarpus siliculosus]|eukprot:CBJ28928.1 expressed unknown protein [Ectocarpus siliculosus]